MLPLLAQPAAPFDKPIDASNAWPSGTFGEDYNLTDANGFRQGPWVRVYPNGELYYVGTFEHGQPVGGWWYFRENGSAISRIVHTEDGLQSDASMFASDGRLTASGSYRHVELQLKADTQQKRPAPPLRQGGWSLFGAQGELTALVHYDGGIRHGLEERYLPSGQIFEQGHYLQGERDGTWTSWNDNGLVRQVLTYREGTLDGPFKAYYGGGQRLSEGAYFEGVEEGSWKFYLEDGRLQHIHRYRDGKLLETTRVNGTFTEWFGDERPASEFIYKDKMMDGPFREWHDCGGFEMETFVDPQLGEEMQRRVMKGVQISREGEYVKGTLDGPVYHYNQQGRLTKTEHFNMGTLERTDIH